jgi:hypothetical protein
MLAIIFSKTCLRTGNDVKPQTDCDKLIDHAFPLNTASLSATESCNARTPCSEFAMHSRNICIHINISVLFALLQKTCLFVA